MKLAQITVYGAELRKIEGVREKSAQAAQRGALRAVRIMLPTITILILSPVCKRRLGKSGNS